MARYEVRRMAGYRSLYHVWDTEADRRSWQQHPYGRSAAKRIAKQLNKEHEKEMNDGSNRTAEAGDNDSGASNGADDHAYHQALHSAYLSITSNTSNPIPSSGVSGSLAAAYYQQLGLTAPVAPTLEHVEEEQPILAHRAAQLVLLRDRIAFKALTRDTTFGATFARAVCSANTPISYSALRYHSPCTDAPGIGCSCGWYAVPADQPAQHDVTTVDLLVELAGRVIEHEAGYRASHQRVVECRLPRCPFCLDPSTVANFSGTAFVRATCAAHVIPGHVQVEREALGRSLGVTIGVEP